MTSTLQTQPAAAGILLVHPRLITPSPATAATFLHWTKLHFRDMLRLEGVTCAMRFSAPEEDPRYSHAVDDEGSGKLPVYLYMCLLSELDVVKGAPYYAVSRKLKLDEEGEEAVKKGHGKEGKDEEEKEDEDESMVFDIVDAKFAVYEKLGGGTGPPPFSPTATTRTMGGKMKCAVICVSISPDSPSSSTDTDMSGIAKPLHDSLLDKVMAVAPDFKTSSCYYRWAGEKAQPDMHPLIDIGASGEWMVMVLLVDEEGETLVTEHVCTLVEGWVDDSAKGIVGAEGGGKVGFGVWEGEVIMA